MQVSCKNCDYFSNSSNGICNKRACSDTLPLRCVGKWSEDKFYYLSRYIDAFTTAMKQKWLLNYVDLFCGPGFCFNRDNEREIQGSPLIALNTRFQFNSYHFTDINKDNIESLKKRCSRFSCDIHYYPSDCNFNINAILSSIPTKSLTLAFIDPTGLDVTYETIKKLAQRKADLIINFPVGMSVKRNLHKFIEDNQSKLDAFLGNDCNWREGYGAIEAKRQDVVTRFFLDLYRQQLEKLGYGKTEIGEERLITSSQKNLKLYYLVFASKNPLGYKLWKQIAAIDHSGQRSLNF